MAAQSESRISWKKLCRSALIYIVGGLGVLIMHIGVVPEMFALIFKSAFTPKMDDELAFLLAKAHHNLGQLEGLIQYAPNRIPFCDLMVLKECTNFCYPSIIIFIISSIADD